MVPTVNDKKTNCGTSLKVTVILRNYWELCSAFSFSSRRSCVSFPVSGLHRMHHRSLRSSLSKLEGYARVRRLQTSGQKLCLRGLLIHQLELSRRVSP